MTSADPAAGIPSEEVSVGGRDHPALVWTAQDDADPRRRTVFGTEDAARRFAAGVPDWSVFSDQDERWRPITGQPTAAEPTPG